MTGRRWAIVALLVLIAAALAVGGLWLRGRGARADAAVVAALRERLGGRAPEWIRGDAQTRKRAWRDVKRAYRHGHRPLWLEGDSPAGRARDLAAALADAPGDGLDPEAYGLTDLRLALAAARSPETMAASSGDRRGNPSAALADLDLRLTAAFLRFAHDRHDGRFPAGALDPDWLRGRDTVNANTLLDKALDGTGVADALAPSARNDSTTLLLRHALATYRALADAGGWPELPGGRELRRGDDDRRVPLLRRRLAREGVLADSTGEVRFDAGLEAGLRAFQARHGLTANGRLDDATRAELDVPAEQRVRTLEMNLERARWLPPVAPAERITVNIPEYRLRLWSGGIDSMAMRVVVGQATSPTPVFSDVITYLEFNPMWRVPKRILVDEILPAFKRDTSYFHRHQMRALWTAGPELAEVDPKKVDWSIAEADTFHVLVRQDAGPENPLGRIKFMCPNEYDVYLHDTPARGLFGTQARDLSHGCVRVEQPVELAQRLLRGTAVDLRDSIAAIVAAGAWRLVPLAHHMPVDVQYWTAWVDSAGAVEFRPDVYGLDRRMFAALRGGQVSEFVINPPVLWGSKREELEALESPATEPRARTPGAR